MDFAFSYVKDHGISKLSDYPYVAKDEACKGSKNSANVKVSGFVDVGRNEQALKTAVGKNQLTLFSFHRPNSSHFLSTLYKSN